MKVTTQIKKITLPTYSLGPPEIHPLFFEKRVYQGSSGKVYPVPFIDKVYDHPVDMDYQAVVVENDFIRLVLLPEIGGRIFEAQDKTNHHYDFFYKQEVIKPALVGLAGPWISGGVEFNWPQHHRPGTFMPCDFFFEHETGGAVTVWMSEHDPMQRMKGMHGIRIWPDRALIEIRVQLFNRTAFTQTFLWWANVAVQVHNKYQSFFPPDVHYVADHAVRAVSSFPHAENYYYGIPYHERSGKNDLRRYQNIPVPTSYMVCQSDYNYFGGYDEAAEGGFIHVANRHISPGKKQWTWGSDAFGQAWDWELTDQGGPYFELMAGVYTDNQPDFSYLIPFEKKTFAQYLWPYNKLGPVQNASDHIAIRLEVLDDYMLDLGVAANKNEQNMRFVLKIGERVNVFEQKNIGPGNPWQNRSIRIEPGLEHQISLTVYDSAGTERLSYKRSKPDTARKRDIAREPEKPANMNSASEQVLVAEHLEQYRHPTRYPEPYLRKAIKLDPFNFLAFNALGRLHLQRGNFIEAEKWLRKSKNIVTRYQPNPSSGEGLYYLGLVQMYMGKIDKAYTHFYKSTWNYEWRAAGYYHLAVIDCQRNHLNSALDHLENALDTNRQNNKAYILKSIVLRKLGQQRESTEILEELLKTDHLDHWAGFELALHTGDHSKFLKASRNDAQTIIDIAGDYAEAGLYQEVIKLLEWHHQNEIVHTTTPNPLERTLMTRYALAWAYGMTEKYDLSAKLLKKLENVRPDYFFPSRLFEQRILQWALNKSEKKSVIAYGLGNYYYDKKFHARAIDTWKIATKEGFEYATVYRNLGIAYWNVQHQGAAALSYYLKAIEYAPNDARIHFEYDQLRKKLNHSPEVRLEDLEKIKDIIVSRDDFTVEYAALLNFTGHYREVLELLENRRFHPWEGGEGLVLEQYSYACLKLGQEALRMNEAEKALKYFNKSADTPDNLGEKYHPLQAKAHIHYWKGMAMKALRKSDQAKEHYKNSIREKGDFIAMAVSEHSEMSYYRALAYKELHEEDKAIELLQDIKHYARSRLNEEARIDYFATSLPLLLVFEEDYEARQKGNAKYLMALAEYGLGNPQEAKWLLREVLEMNAMHTGANSLLKSITGQSQVFNSNK